MRVNFEKKSDLADDLMIIQAKAKTDEIESIIKEIEHTKTVLQCSYKEKTVLIPCHQFIRFFSSNKKIYGLTKDVEYIVKYRLYELEQLLQNNFLRISNNEIVNVHFIRNLELTNNGIILIYFKNGEQTSSSRRYLKNIKEYLL